jgi:acyl-CoA synthetase (NDP forming)
MKSKHEAFETLFADQAEANADLRQMTSASAIRKDLEKNLKAYLNLLTAMKDVSGWELLYSDTNELVKAARTRIRNRKMTTRATIHNPRTQRNAEFLF